ncbi:hypothetical protein DL765_004712 [Monosporascus sp. GIB2]|nr:hypothetical protein DL765_004712 [Monosporascus sp. GIB2]
MATRLPGEPTWVSANLGVNKPEKTLYTGGLLACIAIIVRGRDVAAGNRDKILAHISYNLCQDEDIPGLDEQLNNLFTLDTQTDIQNRQVFVIQASPYSQTR